MEKTSRQTMLFGCGGGGGGGGEGEGEGKGGEVGAGGGERFLSFFLTWAGCCGRRPTTHT